MQIVLDTNVLVSGLLSVTGPPGRIVEAALAGHLQLVFDMAIRREYEDVLRRPELALPAGRVDDLFATIDEFGRRVARPAAPHPLCPQPLPARPGRPSSGNRFRAAGGCGPPCHGAAAPFTVDLPIAGSLLSSAMSEIAQAIANRQSEIDRLQAEASG